jgi:hypothetical protein
MHSELGQGNGSTMFKNSIEDHRGQGQSYNDMRKASAEDSGRVPKKGELGDFSHLTDVRRHPSPFKGTEMVSGRHMYAGHPGMPHIPANRHEAMLWSKDMSMHGYGNSHEEAVRDLMSRGGMRKSDGAPNTHFHYDHPEHGTINVHAHVPEGATHPSQVHIHGVEALGEGGMSYGGSEVISPEEAGIDEHHMHAMKRRALDKCMMGKSVRKGQSYNDLRKSEEDDGDYHGIHAHSFEHKGHHVDVMTNGRTFQAHVYSPDASHRFGPQHTTASHPTPHHASHEAIGHIELGGSNRYKNPFSKSDFDKGQSYNDLKKKAEKKAKSSWSHDVLTGQDAKDDGVHPGSEVWVHDPSEMAILHHPKGTKGKYQVHNENGQEGGFDHTLHSEHSTLAGAKMTVEALHNDSERE